MGWHRHKPWLLPSGVVHLGSISAAMAQGEEDTCHDVTKPSTALESLLEHAMAIGGTQIYMARRSSGSGWHDESVQHIEGPMEVMSRQYDLFAAKGIPRLSYEWYI